MQLLELTLPLDHQWMPDSLFPTATHFTLAPRKQAEKGITLGIDSGTALMLPAQFSDFRRTRRLHEVEPPELILRDTAVVDVPCSEGEEIGKDLIAAGFAKSDMRESDALLLRTGWGDGAPREPGHDGYMLGTPHLGIDGAEYLIAEMQQRKSNLLLLDTALIGYPDKHLIPEWTELTPRPDCWPSDSSRAYLAGYLEREVLEDWAVEHRLAQAGIMTVSRLVNCGAIKARRCRSIVAPLRIIRGVGSPCRVVAVEGE